MSICSPTREKADQLESVPGRGSAAAGDLFVSIWSLSLSLSRSLSRLGRATPTKVWEEAEVEEGACKSEERGLTRCRGGSQGTWEMHSSRCQSPHQPAASVGPVRGPSGPHYGARHGTRRAIASRARAPPSEISRYRFIGRFNGLSPPSRATGMIEWWKNSSGKGAPLGGSRGRRSATPRKKTSERSATKRMPTYRLESDCSHRATSPRSGPSGSRTGEDEDDNDDEEKTERFQGLCSCLASPPPPPPPLLLLLLPPRCSPIFSR